MLARLTSLQLALLASLAVHAGLLTLRFVNPEGFNRVFQDTPLEVVLVNAKSGEAPTKAQAIAQVNLAGGGDAVRGRATSPLPPAETVETGNASEESQRQIEQLQQAQQQLLAHLRREMALLPQPEPRRDAGTPEARAQEERRRQLIQLLAEIEKLQQAQQQLLAHLRRELAVLDQPDTRRDAGAPDARAQEERRRQLVRMLAEIERRVNEENARPKKRYISPATREEIYALYYDSLRRKIEERGTRNFPEQNGRKLYGELTMNITIDAEGRVIETDIVRASKSAVLDRRAIAIVNAAAPFGSFTSAMRSKADQLVITSRFRFTREDGLETSLSASP